MIRDTIKAAQITAMKAGNKDRLAAVRLILAKIKDRDIELRTASQQPDDDAMVVEVMQKISSNAANRLLYMNKVVAPSLLRLKLLSWQLSKISCLRS